MAAQTPGGGRAALRPLQGVRGQRWREWRPAEQAAARRALSATVPARSPQRVGSSSPAGGQNFLERMPPEILRKILSYLDAATLSCVSHVNKLFYHMADDDILWYKLHLSEFGEHKHWRPAYVEDVRQKFDRMEVRRETAGYWKKLYFAKTVGYNMKKWMQELEIIHPFTGLPSKTESVLRMLQVTWELTVTDKSGLEETFKPSQARFFQSSVIVCWNTSCWPIHKLSTLQFHGMMRVTDRGYGLKRPSWRSIMGKFDVGTLSETSHVIAKDKLIELLFVQPGMLIGVWKDQCSIAFVMVSFHFHKLVEKSLLGSSICPYFESVKKPIFDDVDPLYGLHGYTLHLVLHNSMSEIMSGQFKELFCPENQIRDGQVPLVAIRRTRLSQHTPLSGSFSLSWRCEALGGTVENCCMMSVTLLDEFQSPFWCVSSPMCLVPSTEPVPYDYDGERLLMRYQDPEGQVEMELVWMEELKQSILISLTIFVAVSKVNKYFDRNYVSVCESLRC
ncbi:F-box only protein 15 [Lampris incognitus]|uniref:F-box only protein 15 n=1 Tax=Lampris incognitus TaxID=2546036 RepID=UPI0024B4881B|nr:F-box only protein 15 [Lampris incognitus]